MNIPKAYTLISHSEIPEVASHSYLLKHQKSGARLFLLSNEDRNKVFTIGFRTPVSDSTGVPHILEHSVLCGSEKYPVKDPFIEMEKSSLQTYLNAMTFSDKTIYPVASCNDKDFQNLMSVYMDAVLRPRIYQEEKIFRQEGWHYELENAENPLIINGVVYNEMKGAFSSADEVLERYSQATLFPDVSYKNESGGDPEVIPSLTYEEFLNFHRFYYHPSNSYIYLYGNMDMEEKLKWLDEEYLSHYDFCQVDSEIPLQKPFDKPVESEIFYPLTENESPEEHSWFSLQWVTGENTDPILYQAFQILEYALLGAQGAPLKQALLDAGIGMDVFGGYQNSTRQSYFSVVVKDAESGQKEEFVRVVEETLKKVAEEGLGEKALLAALNNLEFRSREADFGSYPKGLMYGIECFDSWLYGADPRVHLQYEKTFAFLRENLKNGYFENLIRKYFLENTHRSLVVLSPRLGLAEEREQQLRERLAAYKASLSEEKIAALVKETHELAAYQEAETPREQLDLLPSLTREDITREIPRFSSEKKEIAGIPVIHHETNTNGITYLRLLYDVSDVPEEQLPALGLLRSLMCLMDTEKHSYQELSHEINIHTGGIGNNIPYYERVDQPGEFIPYFEIHTRVMQDQLPKALELMEEVLHQSLYTDQKRLKELLGQFQSRGEMQMIANGHSTAVLRAASYGSQTSFYGDQIGGISYFRYLQELNRRFGQKGSELSALLMKLSETLFVPERLLVSVTVDAKGYQQLEKELPAVSALVAGSDVGEGQAADPAECSEDGRKAGLADEEIGKAGCRFPAPHFQLEKKNEGFKTAGQIQYVARCGNFLQKGLPYTGALRVLRGILADEYLWNQVRVRGGAYGCMCSFSRSGNMAFVSYRDPHLKRTMKVYEDIVPYLKKLTMDEKTLTGFIISAIGTLDRPMNPSDWGICSLQTCLTGLTDELRQKNRDEVIDCTVEDLRKLADYVEVVLADEQICVVGNSAKLEEEKELFLKTENLVQ